MGHKTLSLSPLQTNLLRAILLISITIAFYCLIQAIFIDIYNPGEGALSIYSTYAYYSMGVCFVASIPLWLVKIQKIQDFYNQLDRLYGSNEESKTEHIQKTVSGILRSIMPQVVIASIIAIGLYFILTTYYITPDVQAQYVELVNQKTFIGRSLHNFDNITLINDTFYTDNISFGVP